MAVWNSDQMKKLLAVPVVHVPSNEHGRVRRQVFAYPALDAIGAAETPAIGDTINLCKLPPGANVVGGKLFNEANTALSTLSVGIASNTVKYLNAQAISAASPAGGVDLIPAGGGTVAAPIAGEKQTSVVTIIGTVGGAILTANKRIYGFVEYLGVE